MTKARGLASLATTTSGNAAISTITNTGTLTLPTSTDTLVGRATTDTLTNKTLTSAALTTGVFTSPFEVVSNSLSTLTTSGVNYDVSTATFQLASSASTGNGLINFRASSGATLNSIMAINQSVTCSAFFTNAAGGFYINAIQVDGSTPAAYRWSGGTAPSAGGTSGYDVYSFTIWKTANATFSVFAAGPVKYA